MLSSAQISGLDYAWNRYYGSIWGRFLSADPNGMSGGAANPQSWNRYAYVEGDPVNWFDPLGLDKIGAGSCTAARDEARRIGGQANFPCPEDGGATFSVTVTAKWSPGYASGPEAMPGLVFDEHRPEAPAPPSGNPGGGGGAGGSDLLKTIQDGLDLLGLIPGIGEFADGLNALIYLRRGDWADAALSAASLLPVGGQLASSTRIAERLTGYTRHGLNSAISHPGGGVSPRAILDALRNPTTVVQQPSGVTRYVGQNAEVVVNEAGRLVTTWPRSTDGRRIP